MDTFLTGEIGSLKISILNSKGEEKIYERLIIAPGWIPNSPKSNELVEWALDNAFGEIKKEIIKEN